MSHLAESPLPPEPGGTPPAELAPDETWLEKRMPAVLVAVLATWVLIASWKALRHLAG